MQNTKTAPTPGKVKVAIRLRPIIGKEDPIPCLRVEPNNNNATVDAKQNIIMKDPRVPQEEYKFEFDSAYDMQETTGNIFTREVMPVLETLFKGYNATVFCYGVTGSGKTFTMQGSDQHYGLIPLTVQRLLEMSKPTSNAGKPIAMIEMSYMEIYNEKVYDLLDLKERDVPIREQDRKIIVQNLKSVIITNFAEFQKTYLIGCKNRKVAATKLNSTSSRSHACLSINVRLENNVIAKLRMLRIVCKFTNAI